MKQVDAHPIEEVAANPGILRGRKQGSQLVDLALVGEVAAAAFLVAPVRGDPALRVGMHFVSADLDLERLALRADHGRVYGAVQVVLRRGDVVVKLAGDELP